jgi:hypothetical protein
MNVTYTKQELLRRSKKFVINALGYVNIKGYYKDTGDTAKVSKKQLIKLYLLNK